MLLASSGVARADVPTALALAAGASDPVPIMVPHSVPLAALDQRSTHLTRLSAQLLDLDAAALDVAATAHRGATEGDLVLAIILRAGRPIPPGLSAARRTQRDARAAEAYAWLRRELETQAGRELVESTLKAALDPLDPRAPAIPELLVAGSLVVAELELVEFAPAVARLMQETLPSDVRAGAQAALFELYARHFEDHADFVERWGVMRGRTPAATGRDDLHAAIDLANDRALQLLELKPELIPNQLDWDDPSMAPRAARAIGRAVAAGVLAPADARASLQEGLIDVTSAYELHARLAVLLDLAQGTDPASDAARDARAAVSGVMRAAHGGPPEIVWVAIGAMPRLPYAEGDEGDREGEAILRDGMRAFRRALSERYTRPLDPDALQGAIYTLRDMALKVEDEDVRVRLIGPFASLLRDLVRDESVAIGVRRAAATSLTISSTEADAGALVQLVHEIDSSELEYELLGALLSVVGELQPGSRTAELVLDSLFMTAADSDFDRRAQALELLLSDDLAPALAAHPRRTRARWAVVRLAAEDSQELRVELLRLIERIGDAQALALLVSRPGLVEDLAQGGVPVARALGQLTSSLRGDDDLEFVPQVARRMAGSLGDGGGLDPERVERLRVALDLVFGLDDQAVSALQQASHRWTLRAAVDLRRAHPVLASAELPAPALDRILSAHIPAIEVSSEAEIDRTLAALARGLFEGDRILLELAALTPNKTEPQSRRADRDRAIAETVEAFDRAITAEADVTQLGWTVLRLRLESVEFLRSAGRERAALGRLGVLFDTNGFTAGAAPPRAIRMFADLARSTPAETEADRDRVLLASEAMLNLVSREEWQGEDDAARLRDLVDLSVLVMHAKTPDRSAESLAYLARNLVGDKEDAVNLRVKLGAVDQSALSALVDRIEALVGDEGGGER